MSPNEQYLYGYVKNFKPRWYTESGKPQDNYGFVCENGKIGDYFFHIENCRREDGRPVQASDLKVWTKVKFLPLDDNNNGKLKAKEVVILSF